MVKLKVVVNTSPNYMLICRRKNHGNNLGVYAGLTSGSPGMATS